MRVWVCGVDVGQLFKDKEDDEKKVTIIDRGEGDRAHLVDS